MNPIQNYLLDKATGKSQENFEGNPFEAYPMDIVDAEGKFHQGFLQDATSETVIVGDQQIHTLDVIWIGKDGKGLELQKECTAPIGCRIRWDEVHCAFTFKQEDVLIIEG